MEKTCGNCKHIKVPPWPEWVGRYGICWFPLPVWLLDRNMMPPSIHLDDAADDCSHWEEREEYDLS